MTVDERRKVAYLAGRLARRARRPLTACPWPTRGSTALEALWFVRGWRSAGPALPVSYR